jgi:S-adenosylmethionine-dependent methyltransferase
LSQKNLSLAREKAGEQGVKLAAVIHGNATSLPALPEVTYDAVLLLGPLYHLLTLPERRQAVAEVRRVLKDKGILFAAFITRFAPLRMAARYPDWIQQYPQRFQEIFDRGINKAAPESKFPDAYFAHPEEIRPFMETAGFEWLNLIGCEGIVAGHEEKINQISGPLWEQWVDLNYKLGQEPTLYGAADHLLYIGRKK